MESTDSQAVLSWNMDNLYGYHDQDLPVKPGFNNPFIVEPDISVIAQIARQELRIPENLAIEVAFLDRGAFNKVYTIKIGEDIKHIMRVSLPVQPHFKTMSEASTIAYIRHHTDIPAPKISASNSFLDSRNELGFEWMIQDFVHGRTLANVWKDMSWQKKKDLVCKIVGYSVQLFNKRFHHLGSIYSSEDLQRHLPAAGLSDKRVLSDDHSSDASSFALGQAVSIPFFYDDHRFVDVERGPYKHSQRWLAAQLEFEMHDANKLEDSDDENADTLMSEDDEDDYGSEYHDDSPAALKRRIRRLQVLLPKIFPLSEKEYFILHHADLSIHNIMIDASHNLTGIIDWECVHTIPLWLACQFPHFLIGPARDDPPTRDEDVENEWLERCYYDDLQLYEMSELRKFFLEEMERVCSEWVDIFNKNNLKQDCAAAVDMLTVEAVHPDIDGWLWAVEKGMEPIELRKEFGQL